jgi:ankyrin repeat protein
MKASINHARNDGSSPLLKASLNCYLDVVQVSLSAFTPAKSKTSIFLLRGQQTRQVLLEAGVNADKPNNIGDTPMTVAAAAGHAKIVLALVQAGADKNKVNA